MHIAQRPLKILKNFYHQEIGSKKFMQMNLKIDVFPLHKGGYIASQVIFGEIPAAHCLIVVSRTEENGYS